MTPRNRRVRYGTPIVVALAGLGWAAVDTDSVGNTVGTGLIAIGLLWLLVRMGRDAGMLGTATTPPDPFDLLDDVPPPDRPEPSDSLDPPADPRQPAAHSARSPSSPS